MRYDPSDGYAWVNLCDESILQARFDLMRESVRKLRETGFLTDAMLAYARWELATLPGGAILITNGDMDTYPAWTVQETEGFRSDVIVAERGLLGTRQFLGYLRDQRHVPIPLTDAEIDSILDSGLYPTDLLEVSNRVFAGWREMAKEGTLGHTLVLATTVYPDVYEPIMPQLLYIGPGLLYRPGEDNEHPDRDALRRSLAGVEVAKFAGPLVDEHDLSCVRRFYTNHLVRGITRMALIQADELIQTGDFEEAGQVLDWAEEFENRTVLGPVLQSEIDELRSKLP